MPKVRYREGDRFAVPLRDGGFGRVDQLLDHRHERVDQRGLPAFASGSPSTSRAAT